MASLKKLKQKQIMDVSYLTIGNKVLTARAAVKRAAIPKKWQNNLPAEYLYRTFDGRLFCHFFREWSLSAFARIVRMNFWTATVRQAAARMLESKKNVWYILMLCVYNG